ncbi:MAG: DUF4389 domain-containing protein [Dehalococcoidia bacterium]
MAYPVTYDVDRPEQYNRLTVAFRLVLVIPHLFLVGGGGSYGGFSSGFQDDTGVAVAISLATAGILTFVASILVFIAWFAILFTGRFPESFRDFVMMIYRWTMNVHAYIALQTNPYPPFSGNEPYPLRVHVRPADIHNRLTVAFRIFLVIPHVIVLFFLQFAQGIVSVIAWFVILITGQYPEGMYGFSAGVSRWYARVYAYSFLLVDEYPPFSLAPEQDQPDVQPRMA